MSRSKAGHCGTSTGAIHGLEPLGSWESRPPRRAARPGGVPFGLDAMGRIGLHWDGCARSHRGDPPAKEGRPLEKAARPKDHGSGPRMGGAGGIGGKSVGLLQLEALSTERASQGGTPTCTCKEGISGENKSLEWKAGGPRKTRVWARVALGAPCFPKGLDEAGFMREMGQGIN